MRTFAELRGQGMRLLGGLAAVFAAVVAVVFLARVVTQSGEAPVAAVPLVQPPETFIPSEADVFRTTPATLAVSPDAPVHRPAHRRTFAHYRALRAYPGAPPRIPHGLTASEFREQSCNTCHERGGFSVRFSAYVPVTPHPEQRACLQCHVSDASIVPTALPDGNPDAVCRQCHATGGARLRSERRLDWSPAAWPALQSSSPGDPPPTIPHDLQMRGNCLACHAAPSGVIEIQTSHPERASCRQCHVEGRPDATDATRERRMP